MAGPRWRRWAGCAAVSVLFFGAFLKHIDLKSDRMFWEGVMDCLHVPAFVGATLFIFWMLPGAWTRGRRGAVSFAVAFVLGVGIEFLQSLTGRQASFNDALNSTAGSFLGALGLAIWPRGRWARLAFTLYAAVVCAGIFLPAWRRFGAIAWREGNFPVLADFESAAEFRLWHEDISWDNPSGAHLTSSTLGAWHGRRAARFTSSVGGGYSGVRLYLAHKDWRGYQAFAFDAYNPGPEFVLSLRLDDNMMITSAYDRFYRAERIKPGWNHVRIPFEEIQRSDQNRPLNLSSMYRLVFFVTEPKMGQTFYLDWIRLE